MLLTKVHICRTAIRLQSYKAEEIETVQIMKPLTPVVDIYKHIYVCFYANIDAFILKITAYHVNGTSPKSEN